MDNFVNLAIRTESTNTPCNSVTCKNDTYITGTRISRLLHAGMGMSTESNEFLDALKKTIFYNKPLDIVNLKEELGDNLWYIAIAMHELGTDFNTEMTRVIEKLKVRYPDKFTSEDAINRDLSAERRKLEE